MKLNWVMVIIFSFVSFLNLQAQEWAQELDEDEPEYITSTFYASRILNTHSVIQPKKGELEFRISHRFGKLSGGAYELWGLDQATTQLSLEYNPIKKLTIGFGRSSFKKTYNVFLKYSILQQQSSHMPLFLSYFGSAEMQTLKNEIPDFKSVHRMRFTHQLLIARKFNKRLSIQLTPTLIHKNLVETPEMYNTIFALGFGGRYKISKKVSVNWDTYWVNHGTMPNEVTYYMPITVGVDIETGGHVFQLLVSNSLPMGEVGFITETTGEWQKGDIHFGFNISRMFYLHY